MTRTAKQRKPPAHDPKALPVRQGKDEAELRRNVAEALARPSVSAGRLLRAFNRNTGGEISLAAAIEEMRVQADAVRAGDMSRAEAILITQAHALNAMFTNLAERAQNQEGIAQIQCLMGLALRSQAQCRATLEALAEIKNPRPVAFVKQANIANGPQQVNNGEPSRAGESPKPANELLGVDDGERLDTGTAGAASCANSPMEALGAVNGAAKP
jgi:hypothetical protein